MSTWSRSSFVLPLAICLGACSVSSGTPSSPDDVQASSPPDDVAEWLRGATSMEVFMLEPGPIDDGNTAPTFRGVRVKSSAEVADAPSRETIADLIDEAIRDAEGPPAMCFNPRHGVRARRGDDTVDLVICFECSLVEVHRGAGDKRAHTISAALSGRVDTEFRRHLP